MATAGLFPKNGPLHHGEGFPVGATILRGFRELPPTRRPSTTRGLIRSLLLIAILSAPVTSAAPGDSAKAVAALSGWLSKPRDQRGDPGAFASVPLTKEDSARAESLLWKDHAAMIRSERTAEMTQKVIRAAGKEMKFEAVAFSSKDAVPKGGRSLFIAMHGGGGAPTALNDSQWKNQVALARAYKPAEGLYVAPRAPTDNWNLWHEPHIDALFARLIENLIVLENVNPDRVYILGYSAGGDGVYQLAPRMADQLAGAAMMAGHPNGARPEELRNVPFAVQVGERDSAYQRNSVAENFGKRLDELRKADPGGYEHFTELHKNKGHWMDTEDRKAIPWMEKFTRNPIPDRIVWKPGNNLNFRSYWLAVNKAEAGKFGQILATRKGQEITLSGTSAGKVTVLLNDAMLNLDQPVVIRSAGNVLHKGTAPRTIATMLRTLTERGDPRLVFAAEVSVEGVAP